MTTGILIMAVVFVGGYIVGWLDAYRLAGTDRLKRERAIEDEAIRKEAE